MLYAAIIGLILVGVAIGLVIGYRQGSDDAYEDMTFQYQVLTYKYEKLRKEAEFCRLDINQMSTVLLNACKVAESEPEREEV